MGTWRLTLVLIKVLHQGFTMTVVSVETGGVTSMTLAVGGAGAGGVTSMILAVGLAGMTFTSFTTAS